jgi:hypothetical protein
MLQKLRDDVDARILSTLDVFERACRDSGIAVTADRRVSEADATLLLGYAPGSLKNLRTLGAAPPHYRRAAGGGRISYRLSDLAAWVEAGREDF